MSWRFNFDDSLDQYSNGDYVWTLQKGWLGITRYTVSLTTVGALINLNYKQYSPGNNLVIAWMPFDRSRIFEMDEDYEVHDPDKYWVDIGNDRWVNISDVPYTDRYMVINAIKVPEIDEITAAKMKLMKL